MNKETQLSPADQTRADITNALHLAKVAYAYAIGEKPCMESLEHQLSAIVQRLDNANEIAGRV